MEEPSKTIYDETVKIYKQFLERRRVSREKGWGVSFQHLFGFEFLVLSQRGDVIGQLDDLEGQIESSLGTKEIIRIKI